MARAGWCPNAARAALSPPAWPTGNTGLLVCLVAALAASSTLVAAEPQQGWTVVTDVASAAGVAVTRVGALQQPFARPAPKTLDPHLLPDFLPAFNVLQDVSPEGDNMFTDVTEQYVATIHGGYVEGEGGLIYDAAAQVYHLPHFHFTRTSPLQPMPQRSLSQAKAECEQYASLASIVQRYGHMYYHFLEEALPRVALMAASGRLTSDVKLLTWGQPYEYEYLELLGVQRDQIVPYNASRVYCTERLLVPTPTPRITPPREGLQAVRHGLGVATLPEASRNLIVYVSRSAEPTRRVANEEAVLAALRAAFPLNPVVVFGGGVGAAEAIALFQRAKVVVGPHGAGLSHALFSAPGTTVLEFLFLADPPLMFWHTAAALGQTYWLLPVPQGYWMQEEMQVPVDEVVDILSKALLVAPASPPACIPGTFSDASDASAAPRCTACSPGSYAALGGSATCKRCAPGRAAVAVGSVACRTCPPGTFSAASSAACLPCPEGTFSALPGAWTSAQCLTAEQRRHEQESQAGSVELLSKLSPVFADQHRRLVELGGADSLTPAQLCAAQLAASGDVYRGPYINGGSLVNCSQPTAFPGVMSPPAVLALPPPPPVLVLPLVDVPSLPATFLPPPPALVVDTFGNQAAPPPPALIPPPKKVVDDYVIILACVLGGLLVLPLLVWLARRCVLARRHRKSQETAATAAPFAYSNPSFQQERLSPGVGKGTEPLHMM